MPPVDDDAAAGESLSTSLFIAAGVIGTLVVAIMLALSDGQQVRRPPELGATGAGQLAAFSPELPTAQLPTPIPTSPPTATPEPSPTPDESPLATMTATAVPVLAEAQCGGVPAGWLPYIVQKGDNLLSLSAASGATTNEILQGNCLELGVVLTGDQIYLPPVPPERPSCGPPIWWSRYAVNYGDTLYSLARRHGTTVYAIMQANCLVSTRIYAGRSLFLPPIAPTAVPTASPTSTGTPIPTPTRVPSATPKPTVLPTATETPIPTLSPTAMPSSTASPTATETPTSTPETTATHTPTTTPVTTATQTSTPTATPTATNTATPTSTPTPLPTNTPTATTVPSPTPTNTPTSTATATPVGVPTATTTPTVAAASSSSQGPKR